MIIDDMEKILESLEGPRASSAGRLDRAAEQICVALHNQLPPDQSLAADELVGLLRKLSGNKNILQRALRRMSLSSRALTVAKKAIKALRPGRGGVAF